MLTYTKLSTELMNPDYSDAAVLKQSGSHGATAMTFLT
jgi:hypothetical protein